MPAAGGAVRVAVTPLAPAWSVFVVVESAPTAGHRAAPATSAARAVALKCTCRACQLVQQPVEAGRGEVGEVLPAVEVRELNGGIVGFGEVGRLDGEGAVGRRAAEGRPDRQGDVQAPLGAGLDEAIRGAGQLS